MGTGGSWGALRTAAPHRRAALRRGVSSTLYIESAPAKARAAAIGATS
eukprot:CAMPEP_0202753088 /NCGR_PEP_ID=MMETSP1388-20130828/13320_1 /ASSEMBLY_ACC=CAM_ASM_000864 /TAXON_ID=37098 /ORGANISM="Isochrysis sp, Strain CCMP1244" /LENGTH=47 /DNA_ID= /DNA_START= /DNA_END= /DNA_ORIENTATION=